MKHALPLLSVVLVACSGTSLEQRIARIESSIMPAFVIRGEPVPTATLAERMEHHRVPGASVAVINDGVIEWARGYGMADVEAGRPVAIETLFQAASISKPVAAMAALKLVEDGALDLDQDVNDKLTSWRVSDNEFTAVRKVTLRSLLNHSAGTTVWGFPGYARTGATPTTVGVLDGKGNTDPIRVFKEPGESWRYSGGGYTVMQLLLADVVGKPFPDLMREIVLEPVGMTASTYEQPLPPARHLEAASGYRGDGAKIEGDWHVYPEKAAAGLWTTPSDLVRYAIEVQRANAGEPATVLSQTMVRQMLEPGMNDHGLGPGIRGGGTQFGHGGSNAGFRSQLVASIGGGWGVAVMTNSDNGGRLAQEILLTVAREYGWPGLEPEEKVVASLTPEEYRAVTGTYRFEEAGEVQVEYTEGRLTAHVLSRAEVVELLPESATEFFTRNDGTSVRFEEEGGVIVGIQWGGGARGVRIEDGND